PADVLPLLNWYDDQLHQRMIFPRPFELPASPLSLFVRKKTAMLRISFGTLVELAPSQGIGAILYPRTSLSTVHTGYLSGLAFGVAKSSPRPAVSIEWCQFISSESHGADMLQQGCGVSGCRVGSWQDPIVAQLYPLSEACSRLANLVSPETVPHNLRQLELYKAWLAATDSFWQGRASPEACAEVLSSNIQQVLDKPILSSTEWGG
ncbi:MAG: hypothetical protein ACYC6L_09460, partial [Anaerolineae bacterium]